VEKYIMENKETMLVELNIDQVPDLIHGKFEKVEELKKNVEKAIKKAKLAKESAEVAKDHSAGLFQKKGAIEALQTVTHDLAEAQILSAQAQELSFEYHQKIAELTKYLFKLGVSGIAVNRSVVRTLELKMNGASQEELDEFARQEIAEVVRQLKEQEDLMRKHKMLSEKVKINRDKTIEHDRLFIEKKRIDILQDEEISRQVIKGKELEKRIDDRVEKDKSQDEEIARQAEVGEKLEKRIDDRIEKDKSQDEEISRQVVKGKELEKRIDDRVEKDKSQDEEIARQIAKGEEFENQIKQLIDSNLEKEEYIKELQNTCIKLSEDISENEKLVNEKEVNLLEILDGKASKKAVIISYIIGLMGIILSAIHFFI
jgi:periplakin (195 kDa cornified envelope precursor protein) (190 kDa paraneoplastic pemphigus antigen).